MKSKPAILFAAALFLSALGPLAFAQTNQPFWQEPKSASPTPLLGYIPASFAPLAEKVNPAVVTVYATHVLRSPFGPGISPFFGIPKEFKQEGVGSGFILTDDGYILTNNHVVAGSDKVKVLVGLKETKEYDAEVKGTDPKTDVALIKIKANNLPVGVLGDSDKLKVGDWVAAIGSPFTSAHNGPEFRHTLTVGVVSAKGRRLGIGPYDDFIQTDASINPGNSGGPLVNMNGEIVGINSVMIAPAGGNVGLGFAIPINLAKAILPQLKDKGKVARSWLGVKVDDVSPDLAESFGMKAPRGALVAEVIKDSPAQKSGIEAGDIIVEFEGAPIQNSSDLPPLAALAGIGRKVEIKILRNGKEETRAVTLEAMPEEKELAGRTGAPGMQPNDLGVQVKDLTPDTAADLGYEGLSGVVVVAVDPNSSAGRQDLQPGDLIQKINAVTLRNAQDFDRAVKALKPGRLVRLYIRRGPNSLFLAFPLER